jgi:hypothetical protein
MTTMADDGSQTRDPRRQARQERLQRGADFWQRALNEGRIIRQAETQAGEVEKPQQRQRGPYRKLTP